MEKGTLKEPQDLNYNEVCLKAYGNPSRTDLNFVLIILNKIMSNHFQKEAEYHIKEKDILMFYSFLIGFPLEHLSINQLITLINSSSSRYVKQLDITKEESVELSKLLLIALCFSFQRLSSTSVQGVIKAFSIVMGFARKMRLIEVISSDNLILIFKIVYLFIVYDYASSNQLRYYKLVHLIIHQLITLVSNEQLQASETEAIVVPIIDFLAVKIKNNINLLHVLKSNEEFIQTLRLLQYGSQFKSISKQKILALVARVYTGNYNQFFFKEYSLMIKNALKHYNKAKETAEDIALLISQLDLVREMIDIERKAVLDDALYCNRGFILSNNTQSGFAVELNQMKGKQRPASMVFAFCPSELLSEKEYPLITFSSIDSHQDYLRVIIKSNGIQITSKSIYRGAYDFKSNRMYLVTIDWKIKSVFTSTVALTIVINNERVVAKDKQKEELDLKMSEDFKVVIGPPPTHESEKYFIGRVYPLLLFKKQLEESHVKSIFDLSGDYWCALDDCIQVDTSHYDRYNPPIRYNLVKKSKDYEELVKFIKDNAILIISPQAIIAQMNKPSKLKFHEFMYELKNSTIKGKENVYEFNVFPSVENFSSYPFQYHLTMSEFLRHEGMGIIALHFEYYYNLLFQKIHPYLQLEIQKGVSSVIKLIVFYIDVSQIQFEVLNEEYLTVLFNMVKVITLLTDFKLHLSQEIGDELVRLFNAILSQFTKSTSQQLLLEFAFKMFLFLLQPRIFPYTDNSLLKKLFHSLNRFLEDYSESNVLITTQTLDLLLNHYMLLSGSLLHENYFLPNKISVHKIALSSYNEYKNMRKEYETLLGTFISKADKTILNRILCYICDSSFLVIRYKLLKIYYFSRNKNLKEVEKKKEKECKLTRKYNDLFNLYSSGDISQKNDNLDEDKYKELIKSILLQLILEFKEKDSNGSGNGSSSKDKQLYDDIKNIKNSIIQSSSSLIKEKSKSNSSFNSQTNKSSNSSNNTSTLPDLKSAPLITIKNIVINGSISFFEVKSIFLMNYDSWDPKAKIFFITEKKTLKSNDYLKFYNEFNLCLDSFNKEKKNHCLFFIQLIYRIQPQEDSTADNSMLLFCNYIHQVYLAYAQSKAFIQPQIQCQFIHLFESRSIMCSFFTICFQSIEGSKYAKAVLRIITSDLVLKHPNPFIFKFAYSHMKIIPGEMVFLMKDIADAFIDYLNSEEQLVSLNKSINILRFILILYKLICSNKITKEVFECDDFSESLLSLVKAFKEKSLYFYSNLLIPISKKNKINKTLYQIFHEIVLKVFDVTEIERKIEDVKELVWLDDYSLFYYLDTRKKKSSAKSKKHKKLYSETQFQAFETELKTKFNAKDNEAGLAVLEFYIGLIRFISKMKLIGVNLEYETLLVSLRAEIIDVYTILGSATFEKEEDTLYNQSLKQVQFFCTNEKPKNDPFITANDIFILIDISINKIVETELNEKKEKMDKSEKSVEKSEIIEQNAKEPALMKIIERKESFTACENKCIEGGILKKSSRNLINEFTTNNKAISSTSFYDLNISNPILCMKRDLLLKQFGVFFEDVYFSNANFDELKRKFKSVYEPSYPLNAYFDQDERQTMSFPSKIKNYSSCKEFYPRMFFKQDLNFFRKSNSFFGICFPTFNRKDFSYKTLRTKHGLLNNKANNLFSNDKDNASNATYLSIFPCERISNEMTCFGYIYITKYYLMYRSDPEFKLAEEYMTNKQYLFSSHLFDMEQKPKQIIIQLRTITELLSRRFLFYPQAIEVFLLNGKSYFFNLFSIKKQLEFIKAIESVNSTISIIRNLKDEFLTSKNYQIQWKRGTLTTFDYLLLVNKYSGRSYNDLNQYPIIPWVFNYLKNSPENRNLKLPISVQSENDQRRANDKFINPISKKHPSHFGIHFSNSAFVNTFLVRLLPFTYNQIKFQNLKFDSPDRQFTSFDMMTSSLFIHLDNRELIPELYLMPEFGYNLNYIEFGRRPNDNTLINNLKCTEAFNSPLMIIFAMKSAINSKLVKGSINHWIDIIFGINQKKIQKGCYIYPKETYEQYIVPKIDAIQKKLGDSNQAKMFECVRKKISAIIPIGQFPNQLFDGLHSQVKRKMSDSKTSINDELMESGNSGINKSTLSSIQKNLPNKPILYFNKSSNANLLYCLIKNLKKKSIAILDMDLNTKNIIQLDRMAMMEKNATFRIYHPKYSIIETNNCDMFITCRYYDNTIKVVVVSRKIKYSIMTESFVNCIKSIEDFSFYSGHRNGRLSQWEIQFVEGQFKSLKHTKAIIAHNGGIAAIETNSKHEIVITSGEDNKLLIRKMYDFELLSVIKLKETQIGVDIQMNVLFNLIYATIFDSIEKKFHHRLYNLNGLLFEETEPQLWCNLSISDSSKFFHLDNNKQLSFITKDLKQKTKIMQLENVASCVYYSNNKVKYIFLSYSNGDISKKILNNGKNTYKPH